MIYYSSILYMLLIMCSSLATRACWKPAVTRAIVFVDNDDNLHSFTIIFKADAMLEAGANPTVCDALGETVLMKAMRNERA
jgi:ankyrin repeat protein